MPSVGFEPVIPATKQPQIYALDRADTGIGEFHVNLLNYGLRQKKPVIIKLS
jgi:hypothetical protein